MVNSSLVNLTSVQIIMSSLKYIIYDIVKAKMITELGPAGI